MYFSKNETSEGNGIKIQVFIYVIMNKKVKYGVKDFLQVTISYI